VALSDERPQAFLARAIGDLGAAQSAALVVLGDKLGLYRALAGAGPLTPTELAQRTGTVPRLVREWLVNQAASGYLAYDAGAGTFTLPEEHAQALASEGTRASLGGAFQTAVAMVRALDAVEGAFRGEPVGYSAWGDDFFAGLERESLARLAPRLVAEWLAAVPGLVERLEAGASVADFGCGRGVALRLMAEAFPRSRFLGVDEHQPSIAHARRTAFAAGLGARVTFETAGVLPGAGYALITCFDTLHDVPDPLGVARSLLGALAPEGVLLLVEPAAGATIAENLNPLGRYLSAASTLHCVPVSLGGGGRGLGLLAGESKLREVLVAAGFTRVRRVAESPLDVVLEARP